MNLRTGKKVLFIMQDKLGTNKSLFRKLEVCCDLSVMRVSYERKSDEKVFRGKYFRPFFELLISLYLVFSLPKYLNYDLVFSVARQSHLSYLLVFRLLRIVGIQRNLYLYGFYVQSWASRRLARHFIHWTFMDNIATMAQSQNEMKFFRDLGVTADIRYAPYARPAINYINKSAVRLGDYVFAGGHSNRDYNTVLKCAERLPDIRFMIVCAKKTKIRQSHPPNVNVVRDMEWNAFHEALAGSRIVLVPLLNDVGASGQSVALAAMQFEKLTVYSDVDSVRQYFANCAGGVAYPCGDSESLARVIREYYHDTRSLIERGRMARAEYLRKFTRERFDDAIIEHVKSILYDQPVINR
jgi:glycosyltransferase involved in cell wall biosynthesis